MKSYLVHALFSVHPHCVGDAEETTVWEIVYLLKSQSEEAAQKQFLKYMEENGGGSFAECVSSENSELSNFIGVRFVAECGDGELEWSYAIGDIVELTYVEYVVKCRDLRDLVDAEEVSVKLTRISRRIKSGDAG
mgnify:CR=1 FL=1